MATVRRTALAYDSTLWADWFDSLDCSLVSLSGTDIIIDDIFMIKLERINYWPAVALYKDGTMITSSTVYGLSTITVAYSDTLFYIRTRDENSDGIGIFFVYEKTSAFTIYTYNTSTASGFQDIKNYTFTDINNQNTYKHGAILNYAAQSQYINYCGDVLLQGTLKSYGDPNFIACSTITPDNVITFGSKNYYAVGTNTLVRMD